MSGWLTRLMCRMFGCYPAAGAPVWSRQGYDQATCCYCHRPIWARSIKRRELNPLGTAPAAHPSGLSRSAGGPLALGETGESLEAGSRPATNGVVANAPESTPVSPSAAVPLKEPK